MTPIRYYWGADGIVTVVLDDPGRSANTMTDAFRDALEQTVSRLERERNDIAGVILTSAKKTFLAGADLTQLVTAKQCDAAKISARATRTKGLLRRLERLGRPVVAVIHGSALGGGVELILACHYRIVADDPSIRLGFPEVTLGLLPGGGGIARSIRLVGVLPALAELLLDGRPVTPQRALELGLVNDVAPADEMLSRARTWISEHPDAQQPWDVKGFSFPGGDGRAPAIAVRVGDFSASLRKKLKGCPAIAAHHILCAAVEGSVVDIDTSLSLETRYYVDLVTGPVSTNMIQGHFLDRQVIAKGGSRPDGVPRRMFSRVGVVGAGMMGAGIAYACAARGLDVVLHDVDLAVAEQGKAYSSRAWLRRAKMGNPEVSEQDLLARITPTADLNDLASCDAVIEAVYENAELKREVFGKIKGIVGSGTLLATNTSTLPVTELATALTDPTRLVGMHFFSPVDRMELVEIVRGRATSPEAQAGAFDLALVMGKVPIIVNDSRGFFTSRVFGKFTREGVAMLAERVPAATINQASSKAGYPVPVLQLMDELSLSLPVKIRKEAMAAAAAAGQPWVAHPSEPVYDRMVDGLGRMGRAVGAGFYDYLDGQRAALWPGLEDEFGPSNPAAVPFEDLVERLLFSEALEALRCLEEGVIASAAEANVGSLLGISYPGWTGGVIQYVNGYTGGPSGFLARAQELTDRYGTRFAPPSLLIAAADGGKPIR